MSDAVNQSEIKARVENLGTMSTGRRRQGVSGRIYIGVIYLLAAIGLWVLGPDGENRELLKLFFCAILTGLGLIFLSPKNPDLDVPEVAVNTVTRTIHLIYFGKEGRVTYEEEHKIDDLSELSLKNSCFVARDQTGRQVISIGLSDRRTEQEVRVALSQVI